MVDLLPFSFAIVIVDYHRILTVLYHNYLLYDRIETMKVDLF